MQILVHTPTVLVVSTLRTPLDGANINSAVKNSYWRVSVVDVTGSTHNDLVLLARNGKANHGDVIVAEFQTHGRGRLDRTFESPSHSALLFSMYIQPQIDVNDWGWLALLAGMATSNAIAATNIFGLNKQPQLKWPNDVLIGDKKVSGILAERIDTEGVVIGIGINVSTTLEELPVTTATSLAIESGTPWDRNLLLVKILEEFAETIKRWEAKDVTLSSQYLKMSATVGRQVRIQAPDGNSLESQAVGIDANGSLVLRSGEHVSVGDVVHLHAN